MLETLDNFSLITWTGLLETPLMVTTLLLVLLLPAAQELCTTKTGAQAPPLGGHSVVCTNVR